MTTVDGFVLSRHWRDGPRGLELSFWIATSDGPYRLSFHGEEAVCFVERTACAAPAGARRKAVDLRALGAGPVDALYFRSQRDLVAARGEFKSAAVRVYETDVKPSERFLMERFITAAVTARGEPVAKDGYVELVNPAIKRGEARPALRWASIDIETDGLEGALYSVAVHSPADDRVFMVSGRPVACEGVAVEPLPDERSVLEAFFDWLVRHDPDLILGWNVIGFDLDYLERCCQRLGIAFDVARGRERATILQPGSAAGTKVARIPGRAVLDGIDCLRAGFWSFESFELEAVARAMLGRGKRIDHHEDRVEEINRLYREAPDRLARYNIEDCRLVAEIFEHAELIAFSVRRAELTGLAVDRQGGSVAAFDNLYLPRLHRAGYVAPDVADVPGGAASPGGYVLDSKPGLYENVLLLDFKSLYPSIIRTFHIDPYGMHVPGEDPIPGFLDAAFARERAILPELVESLWAERDRAKARGDAALSQAVKILMNSFYGVLGASGCRFHDPRLASSITRRGHEIIQRSRDFIEAEGHEVIYGDTDSLFILLGPEITEPAARSIGETLAGALTDWWRRTLREEFDIESFLELEFETHFIRFLMPRVRGEQTGSKKRYAGLVRGDDGGFELVFKGLESVRTDWTPLARRFQRELYRRIFLGEPFEAFVRDTLAALQDGAHDAELVYRKRLRRGVDEYTRNVPPHVQAARKLGRPVRWIRYVITASGPEPVVDDTALPRPDYAHYRDRQLAPAADGILSFVGTSFEALTDKQMELL